MTGRFLKLFALTGIAFFALPSPAQAMCTYPKYLTGVWKGNDGGTYQVRESGNRVSWHGQSGDNGQSWAHRFSGTRSGDVITGSWADYRGPMGRGTLTIRVNNTTDMRRIGATGSGFSGTRWRRSAPCNDVQLNPVNE